MKTELSALYTKMAATRLITMYQGNRILLDRLPAEGEMCERLAIIVNNMTEYADEIEELNDIAVSKFNIDLQDIPLERWIQG
jgi:hypothetical protein